MGFWNRPGKGKIVSSHEAKGELGRGFRRTKHEGGNPDPTAWEAQKNLQNLKQAEEVKRRGKIDEITTNIERGFDAPYEE